MVVLGWGVQGFGVAFVLMSMCLEQVFWEISVKARRQPDGGGPRDEIGEVPDR